MVLGWSGDDLVIAVPAAFVRFGDMPERIGERVQLVAAGHAIDATVRRVQHPVALDPDGVTLMWLRPLRPTSIARVSIEWVNAEDDDDRIELAGRVLVSRDGARNALQIDVAAGLTPVDVAAGARMLVAGDTREPISITSYNDHNRTLIADVAGRLDRFLPDVTIAHALTTAAPAA